MSRLVDVFMSRILARAGAVVALAISMLLAGCAALAPAEPPPLLRLSPASLGRELTVVQRLDVQAVGQTRSFDVALEVDAAAVRMAVLQMGLTVARLDWDNQKLVVNLAPNWPKAVSAEQVLNDLQLVWWPAQVVRAALPAGWSLEASPQARTLRQGARVMTSVRLVAAGHVELVQHDLGYVVQIHTQDATPVFDSP